MHEKSSQFGRMPTAVVMSGVLADVKPAAMKVYAVLVAYSQNWQVKIGVRKIAELTGLLIGTVSTAIGQLCELGLITTNGPANGRAYIYTLSQSMPNRSAPAERCTVQRQPNGIKPNRSAPADGTVQRPQDKPFSARRTIQKVQSNNQNVFCDFGDGLHVTHEEYAALRRGTHNLGSDGTREVLEEAARWAQKNHVARPQFLKAAGTMLERAEREAVASLKSQGLVPCGPVPLDDPRVQQLVKGGAR